MDPASPASSAAEPGPAKAPSGGLRSQLLQRFTLVFVVVTLVGNVAALAIHREYTANANRKIADNRREHVARSYARLTGDWQRNADEVKAQIDFMRIFAGDDPDSWLRLRAYFAALEGMARKFESGLILHDDGRIVFTFGRESASLRSASRDFVDRGWYFGASHREVHELVAVPIWLGAEGRGRMVLLQTVDAGALRSLAPPGTTLQLAQNGQVIASSEGSVDIGRAIDASRDGPVTLDGRDYEQRVFTRYGTDPDAPRIVVLSSPHEPIPRPVVLLASTALLALLSVVLWLVIGRWAQGVARRVASLSSATRGFAQEHAMGTEVRQALDRAQTTADEIGEVAASYRDLMHNVLVHDEEHFAYLQTLDILEEGVVELDREGRYLHSSPGWHKLSGCSRESSGPLYDCIHPEDVTSLRMQFLQLFSGEKANAAGRVRLWRSGDDDTWVEYRFVPGTTRSGITSIRGVLRDISQGYLLEKHISHMALHDALTGLPNRVLLEDRCLTAMRMAARSNHPVAVAFIDLDHFKYINDHFGHSLGDQVLVTLSRTLRECVRSGDTLARWGGDEFVVLLPDIPDAPTARDVASKLMAACEKPIEIQGTEFNVTFSMGVALFPDDAQTMESLLSQADRAMFYAKEQGRNNVQFFSEVSRKDRSSDSLYIQNRLAGAIKARQIQAWFQPVVDAGTRRIVACEALARWHDEVHGWIPPDTFIPMAENLGLIQDLGRQVWQEALGRLKRWREAGMEIKLAVNISRRQLFAPHFTAELREDLERAGVPVSCIELEITESVAIDAADHTSRRLRELVEAGFSVSIDDFGRGYSSLSQLHEMPATTLKIDISFVRRIHDPQGAQLVSAIIHMAKAFGLQTVAEGVEDEPTAAMLRGHGVTMLQGYHFGRPMPSDELDRLLAKQRADEGPSPAPPPGT